jgi:hypothetical protein
VSPSRSKPERKAKSRSTRAFVDAIDEGRARLLVGEKSFTVPAELLPPGAREGDWVDIAVTGAPAPPDEGEARRRRLGERDPGGDIEL